MFIIESIVYAYHMSPNLFMSNNFIYVKQCCQIADTVAL